MVMKHISEHTHALIIFVYLSCGAWPGKSLETIFPAQSFTKAALSKLLRVKRQARWCAMPKLPWLP